MELCEILIMVLLKRDHEFTINSKFRDYQTLNGLSSWSLIKVIVLVIFRHGSSECPLKFFKLKWYRHGDYINPYMNEAK